MKPKQMRTIGACECCSLTTEVPRWRARAEKAEAEGVRVKSALACCLESFKVLLARCPKSMGLNKKALEMGLEESRRLL